ncbi:MAG: maleylpyruvate isomerase family mycothiol-dependent enzyme, partial [Bacteroidota bacterium]
IVSALDIPYVTAEEAFSLLQTELKRFMDLIEALPPRDWSLPTACTAWNVQAVVAHQAGGYLSGTGYGEMIRQYSRIRPGRLPEDAINELQVKERARRTHQELIAELHQVGPAAIKNWAYGFRLLKPIPFPHALAGMLKVRHLMWVIHSRDTWMHRLDICRAVGRPFQQTPEHDGRINQLVVLDASRELTRRLKGRGMIVNLSGTAGGRWRIGRGEPQAQLEMDVLDFNLFVSGRLSYVDAMGRARISGDRVLVENVLQNFLVLF